MRLHLTVAIVSLVAYEYLLMLDYEIRYLWGRRFSMGGILLGLCRYLPFASVLQLYLLFSTTDSTPCLNGYRAIACIIYSEFLISVFVLFARAYAVWGRSRRILFFLGFIYAGAFIGSSYSMVVFLIGLTEPKDDVITHCLLELGNDDMWIAVVILVCCESLALGLLLYKSVQHARAMRNFANESSTQNLLAVMARDGIGYFFCTLGMLLVYLESMFLFLRPYETSDHYSESNNDRTRQF
ncbi:hypothetical protein SCHPADRAFT_699491 [Schizopora paradoxa]|uniref:DUF6533 domain-containing protein n=1 Tax=Schizopora paradoxa TaxID=27342 RepID=A0A0H2R2Y9_9AGAM|nr:hypothetical protein SCHPADRAFT_699491 [Schizopora paradoxa]